MGHNGYVVRVVAFAVLAFMLLQTISSPLHNNGDHSRSTPTPAANCASNNTFPAQNQQLFTSNNYNFTSNVRDEASLNRNWDSTNLVVGNPSGTINNVTQTPLGTFNGTYSFTSDRAGGLAESFAYSDITKFSVVASYLGHLQLHRGTTAAAAWQTASVDFATGQSVFSYWICAASGTYNAVRLYRASDNAIMQIAYLDVASTVFTISTGVGMTNLAGFAANRWYFVAVVINWAAKTYQFYVDGVMRANGLAIYTVAGAMEVTRLAQMVYTPSDAYIDGVQIGGNTTNAVDLGQIGIYNATHSFEGDTMFVAPTSTLLGTWADASGASCYAKVSPAVLTQTSYHHNVLALDDQNAGTAGVATFTLTDAMTTGTVEAWIYSSLVTKTNHAVLSLLNTGYGTTGAYLYIDTSVLYMYGTGAVSLGAVASNTWYHVRIQFNTDTDLVSAWVNGILKTSNQAMTPTADVKRVQYSTGTAANTAFQVYLDALDISSDPAYYPERSTFMFLNSTTTFPVNGTMLSFPTAGAYSYKWQAWAGGIAYDQSPVPFSVSENVQLISESEKATQWLFTTGGWTNLYASDFSVEEWKTTDWGSFYDVIEHNITSSAYIDDGNAGTNYGANVYLDAGRGSTSDHPNRILINYPTFTSGVYLTNNVTAGGILKLHNYYSISYPAQFPFTIHTCGAFDESTVTWNTAPTYWDTVGIFMSLSEGGIDPVWGGDYTATLTNGSTSLTIKTDETHPSPAFVAMEVYSDDAVSLRPTITPYLSKFYRGSGLCYVQTDIEESITLRSPVLTPILLQPSDRIRIYFNATNTHRIDLLFDNAGTTVKTLKLTEEGITNPNSQIATYVMTSTQIIDGLNFTGIFDDVSNLQITNIVIDRPSQEYFYFINPFGQTYVSLSPGAYTALIIAEGNLVVNISSPTIIANQLNILIYTPIPTIESQINFYDQQGRLLAFEEFRCNLTRTYENATSNFILSTNRFIADTNSYYSLYVTDLFDRSLVNRTDYAVQTYIDVQISVYSLKIENQMVYPTLIYLNTSVSQYLAPGEIAEYILYNGTYQFNYTQPELGINISVILSVTGPMLYVMNTSFYSIYFSAFSNDLLGLPQDSVRLYCNNTRKEWGPVELLGIYQNVTVLSYFNDTIWTHLFDGTPGNTLSEFAEYNIFVDIATLIIQNIETENAVNVTITKNAITLFNQTIDPKSSLVFRFIAGNPYVINCTFLNGTMESRTISLVANNTDLMSFGVLPAHAYTYSIIPITPQGTGLPWEEFLLKVNGTQASWGFHSTSMTSINATVTDYFGNVLNSTIFNVTDGANLLLMVTTHNYKITNLMRTSTLVNWSRNGISWMEYVEPGEIAQWDFFAGTYILNYTQTETNTPVIVAITISGVGHYTINTSYYTIFFSAHSSDNLGIPDETVRLYINGTRKAWGPVEVLGANHSLLVLDYVGDVQYNATVDLSNQTELILSISMATLLLTNQLRTESIYLSFYKAGTLFYQQEVPRGGGLIQRFTVGTYDVDCLYKNGTVERFTFTVGVNGSVPKAFGGYADQNLNVDMTGVIYSNILTCIIVFGTVLGGWYLFGRTKDPLQEHVKEAKLPKKLYSGRKPPQIQNESVPIIGKRHSQ